MKRDEAKMADSAW